MAAWSPSLTRHPTHHLSNSVLSQFLFPNSRRNYNASYFRHTRLSERVLSVPFPEASPELIAPDIRQMVYGHLPSFEDALGACELFLNYSTYMYVFLLFGLFRFTSAYQQAGQDLFLDKGGIITHS
jgi:hypothetical protein